MQREDEWTRGYRAAMLSTLRGFVSGLGYEGRTVEGLIVEREAAISMLRMVCDDLGDNDWDESLHLADIIEKHLWRNIADNADGGSDAT